MGVRPKTTWRQATANCVETLLGNGEDGVLVTLDHRPTCYRRGPYRALIEVLGGKHHHDWGCFDEADQPERNYHGREAALSEIEAILDVLWKDRFPNWFAFEVTLKGYDIERVSKVEAIMGDLLKWVLVPEEHAEVAEYVLKAYLETCGLESVVQEIRNLDGNVPPGKPRRADTLAPEDGVDLILNEDGLVLWQTSTAAPGMWKEQVEAFSKSGTT